MAKKEMHLEFWWDDKDEYVPMESAKVIEQAFRKGKDLLGGKRKNWRALEIMSADFLASDGYSHEVVARCKEMLRAGEKALAEGDPEKKPIVGPLVGLLKKILGEDQ